MKGLLGTMYNDEMNVTGRDLREVGVEIDAGDNITVEVDVTRCGDMIENIDGPNTSNLPGDAFGEEDWIRQLQGNQLQEGNLIGQGSDNGLIHPQKPQYHLAYDQNISLTGALSGSGNSNRNGPQPEPLQNTGKLSIQEPQPISQFQVFDGLPQLQHGADNIGVLDNLFQQQQQQQCFPLGNNTIQRTESSSETNQAQEQQIRCLQQQQEQQLQQQTPAPILQQSLIELQKLQEQQQHLQEQQQQILKNISNAGLIDANAFANPLGTLLGTLIGQGNGNGGGSSNSHNTGNAAILGACTWGQIPGLQVQINNNTSPNPIATIPNLDPQIQALPVGFGEKFDPIQDSRQKQFHEQVPLAESQHAPDKSHISIEDKSHVIGTNENNAHISAVMNPSPAIRKTDKKREPNPFPKQLWEAMMTDGYSNHDAYEWLPDGKSFVVVDSTKFCTEILDRHFKQSKYGSFVRKLHRWGFIRLTSGTGTDCFHHPMFQRNNRDLVTKIKCNTRNGKNGKEKGHNPYARGDIMHSVQPSLMGVEKFTRTKVVSPDSAEDIMA
ncbi:unnamed protein product [Pseudo-nitzschia multistriata]|uniref:HSF-type DNA-binding domain-containing protein n=1 Tax=Pseudo-nitzschia multistriata TaxID=183589 RepID=A0A448YW84_9STRA|nr:unnamed protein product [Pseudo-nitzschia multistriata]